MYLSVMNEQLRSLIITNASGGTKVSISCRVNSSRDIRRNSLNDIIFSFSNDLSRPLVEKIRFFRIVTLFKRLYYKYVAFVFSL